MQSTFETFGGITVVAVQGQHLDAGNAESFKANFTHALQKDTHLVFDVSSVRFIDSCGINAIMFCLEQVVAAGGNMNLCGASDQVLDLFKLSRMHRLFYIFGTRREAINAFGSNGYIGFTPHCPQAA